MLRTETEPISGFGDAFDKADKNHSGRLTREEFNSAWTEYKRRSSPGNSTHQRLGAAWEAKAFLQSKRPEPRRRRATTGADGVVTVTLHVGQLQRTSDMVATTYPNVDAAPGKPT